MPTFALVDCNNFYVSCERLFQPDLQKRPVVVLSNNDGCVIARSQEAKDLGIAMGAPLFKVRKLVDEHGIVVRSTNYALYGDISYAYFSQWALGMGCVATFEKLISRPINLLLKSDTACSCARARGSPAICLERLKSMRLRGQRNMPGLPIATKETHTISR